MTSGTEAFLPEDSIKPTKFMVLGNPSLPVILAAFVSTYHRRKKWSAHCHLQQGNTDTGPLVPYPSYGDRPGNIHTIQELGKLVPTSQV